MSVRSELLSISLATEHPDFYRLAKRGGVSIEGESGISVFRTFVEAYLLNTAPYPAPMAQLSLSACFTPQRWRDRAQGPATYTKSAEDPNLGRDPSSRELTEL